MHGMLTLNESLVMSDKITCLQAHLVVQFIELPQTVSMCTPVIIVAAVAVAVAAAVLLLLLVLLLLMLLFAG
jgi:hypothetical protein